MQITITFNSIKEMESWVAWASVPRPSMRVPTPEELNGGLLQLQLRRQTHNALVGAGIETLGQLLERTDTDLLHGYNFGRGSLKEVKEALARIGLTLPEVSLVKA